MLAAGYALGQGSVFATLIFARYLGYNDIAGLFVLLVSILSFCFQFSDFGNQNYLLKKIAEGNTNSAISYINARSLFALCVCIIFSIWVYANNKVDNILFLLLFIPLIGMICGSSQSAFVEFAGNYRKLVLINVLPWLTMTCGLMFFFIVKSTAIAIVLLVILSIIGCSTAAVLAKKLAATKSQKVFVADFHSVAPFVLSPIGGQIWFRYVIFYIGATVGLSSLGAMGIVRNLQIAALLCIGFAIRPALRLYIQKTVASGSRVTIAGVLSSYKWILIYSTLTSFIILSFVITRNHSNKAELWYWLPIIATLPLTIIGQSATAANQLRNGSGYIIFTEYACLFINAVIFLFFVNYNPVLAIVASEASHAIALVTAYFFVSRRVDSVK